MGILRRGLFIAFAALVVAAPAHARDTTVVVTLDAPPLAHAIAHSRALSASAKRRLDVRTPTSVAYLRAQRAAQASIAARVTAAVPAAKLGWRYGVVANGFSVTLPDSQVARLARVHGVARVWPSVRYRAALDRSVPLIGAPALWGADFSSAGNGMKIAVIDDGIDPSHPFFAGTGFAPPPGFPKGQTQFTNGKIIVARAFPPRAPSYVHASKPFDPELSAHGTHVAGIAAGNAGTRAEDRVIAGVAPRAYLGNYKVLTIPTDADVGLDGNSPEIAAGIEAAVADGMNVINLSLGEPEVEPSRDLVVAAINAAADAGVVPVLAAGNDFPEFGRGSVGSPGSAAKAITVGAVTKGRAIADFSSSGPTPLSLQLKPEVVAPGASILSSVPVADGSWEAFSGTSMAAPHVAGAAALLRQRHPQWTPAQVKSALAVTAEPIPATSTMRQGAGLVNLVRADTPLLHASPVALSLGLLRPGASATAAVDLTDAGGGAGDWQVTLEQQRTDPALTLAVPATVVVPGRTTLTATVGATANGDFTGWIVFTRAGQQRRVPYWLRVTAPKLSAPVGTLGRAGIFRGDTRRGVNRASAYAFPETAPGIATSLSGPELVYRVNVTRPVANFGVVVLSGRAQPRILVGADESRLAGYPALPLNINPYLRGFLRPEPVAGATLPAPGAYSVVFDSFNPSTAGPFSFRFWIDDVRPPRLRVVGRTVRRGKPLQVRVTDAGAGVDPRTLYATIDNQPAEARLRAGVLRFATGKLRRGRHTLFLQVSDHQEAKNNENQPRILPNTTRLRVAFSVR